MFDAFNTFFSWLHSRKDARNHSGHDRLAATAEEWRSLPGAIRRGILCDKYNISIYYIITITITIIITIIIIIIIMYDILYSSWPCADPLQNVRFFVRSMANEEIHVMQTKLQIRVCGYDPSTYACLTTHGTLYV